MDRDCKECKLYLTRKHTVPGEGPIPSQFMFIGEAPGREEDEEGRPFCNEAGAGRILNALLKAANIRRREVFITNPVKCRPPNNRIPEPDELEACRPYLIDEIERVKPKCLVALGEVASLILTGKNLKHRGMIETSFPTYKSLPTLITYHPAYLTRGKGDMFNVIANDLSKLHNLDFYLQEDPQDYIYNPSPLQLQNHFDYWRINLRHVSVDIETAGGLKNINEDEGGLNPFTDVIVGIAFCGEFGHAINISGNLALYWPIIKDFLENYPFIEYQNNRFDRAFLKLRGINSKVHWDTYTGMYLIHSGMPRKLDYLRSLYTNIPPYKTKSNYKANLNWLNCRDVDVTRRISEAQKIYVNSALMKRRLKEDDCAIDMRIKGVRVDQNKLAEHYALIYPQVERLEREFIQKYNIDLNSPKQLSNLLFNEFELPDFSNKKSTDEKFLKKIYEGLIGNLPEKAVLDDLFLFRETAKIKSTYCEGIFNRIQDDGKLHPEWLPLGTDTARWACHNPNMMNFPKHMRDMIIPSEGCVFFGGDYSKMQVWGAALLAQDEDLIEVLSTPGRNIHEEVLIEIEKVYPLTQHIGATQALLRAKAVVFGTFFGRTAVDIAREFNVSVDIAKLWQEQFIKRFYKTGKYLDATVAFWQKNHYIEGIYGHRKYALKVTEAKNGNVQNFEAEVVINAMFALKEKGFNTVISVHDQLICEEPEENKESRFKEFIEIMETSSTDIYPRFSVQGKIGMNWKEV